MAESLLGGAAVGAVFGELLKAVLVMKSRVTLFKQTLGYLQTTLIAIAPVIKEIEQHNNDLGRPKEELESLIKEMEQGTKLVYKCSKIGMLNFPAKIQYQRQLEKLVESLERFFIINMQAQTSRDQKETLLKVTRILSVINKAGSDAVLDHVSTEAEASESKSTQPDKEEVGTNFVEQVMEHITSQHKTASQDSGSLNSSIREESPPYSSPVMQRHKPLKNPQAGNASQTFDSQDVEQVSSKNPQFIRTALYNFPAEGDDELSLTAGEEVEIEYEVDGWFYVKKKSPGKDGKMAGLVPAQYIEPNTENSQSIDRSMSEKFYDQLNTNEKRSNHLPKIEPVLQHKIGGFKGQVIRKDPFEPRKIIAFEGCPSNFDLEDLLSASVEVLVETVYGTSYKAMLKDGTTLVMKRFKLDVVLEKTEFEKKMKIVQRISQHPNVVPLLACYYSNHEKLLIYDCIAGHSFSTLLHGTMEIGQTELGWASRMKISLGVAKGIAHIHSANEGEFVHGNISSSNVLVKADHQGCISYFGLNSLINDSINQFGNEIKGYQAPEVFQTKELTHKSDVYSFGILLFEMLTTKSPLQYNNKFLSWVFVHGKKRFHLLASDDHAIHQADMDAMCRRVMELAIACVARKPTMNEVVNEMEEIIIASKSN